MGDDLGIGIGPECGPLALQFLPQLAKILDDAVVNHGQTIGSMRVRIAFGGTAVGGPARVPDPDGSPERLALQSGLQIAQLALGTPARQLSAFQRRHPGRIVATIFQPLECVDE